MAIIGYARVSTTDPNLKIQESALRAAGAKVIRAEKASSTTVANQGELQTALDLLRAGDTLVVTRIDRLARSVRDLQEVVSVVSQRGAFLKTTEQPIDTRTTAGKFFLDMLALVAEFEINLRKERQLEGIAKAKSAGIYKGRKATVPTAQVREMRTKGMRPTAIAKALGIARASVYRALAAAPKRVTG